METHKIGDTVTNDAAIAALINGYVLKQQHGTIHRRYDLKTNTIKNNIDNSAISIDVWKRSNVYTRITYIVMDKHHIIYNISNTRNLNIFEV